MYEGNANLIGNKWQEKHLWERGKKKIYGLQSIFLRLAWSTGIFTSGQDIFI